MKRINFIRILELFVLLLVAGEAVCYGQKEGEKSVMSLLQSSDWKMKLPTDKDYEVRMGFTKKELIDYLSYNEGETSVKKSYYLSDTMDENFQHDKVGKIKNGKYIISLPKDDISVYEIIELTPMTLKIKVKGQYMVLEYEAVKKKH